MKKLLFLAVAALGFFACKKDEKAVDLANTDWFALLADDQKPLVGHWTDSKTSIEGSDVRTFIRVDTKLGTHEESYQFHATGGVSFYPNAWKSTCASAVSPCVFSETAEAMPVFYGSWKMENSPDGERILTIAIDGSEAKKWKIRELTAEVLRFSEL